MFSASSLYAYLRTDRRPFFFRGSTASLVRSQNRAVKFACTSLLQHLALQLQIPAADLAILRHPMMDRLCRQVTTKPIPPIPPIPIIPWRISTQRTRYYNNMTTQLQLGRQAIWMLSKPRGMATRAEMRKGSSGALKSEDCLFLRTTVLITETFNRTGISPSPNFEARYFPFKFIDGKIICSL